MTDGTNLNVNNDVNEWARKRMEAEQKVEQRKETLDSHMKNESFKYLYDNGMKDLLESDPTILDNETATKMAMQSAQAKIQLAEATAKATSATEVKQENTPTQSAGSGPATQSAGAAPAKDPYDEPIKNFKDIDTSRFKNLSEQGELAAEMLKLD